MGYDLKGKKRGKREGEYFRAGFIEMTLLRASMVEAGVYPKIIYKKFVGNDGLLVTPIQAAGISARLDKWLEGKHLTITLPETDRKRCIRIFKAPT